MSEEWLIIPLSQVMAQRKEFIEIDDTQTYKRCRVQLHAKGVELRDIVTGSEVKTKRQQVCRAGEFLVAEIDAKVGGFGMVSEQLDGAIVSSHYFLFVLNEAVLERRFLNYFIRILAFREQVTAQGSTNYAAIRPSDVLGYTMPLPPLAEQRRIVARIDELAAKIEEAKELRRQTAAQVEYLITQSMAATFDACKECFGADEIGKHCQTTSGGTPSRQRTDYYSGDIPWLKSGELEDEVIVHAEERITQAALTSSSAKLFPAGTLVVALYGATVGKTGILGLDAATNQAICAVFPKDTLKRDYVWRFLKRMRPVYLAMSFGGAQPNISQKIIRDTSIPVPPIPEQNRIIAYLDGLQAKTDALKALQAETAAEIDALLPSVLDRAFTGQL